MPHPDSKRAKAAKAKRASKRKAITDADHQERAERRSAHHHQQDTTRIRRRRRARAWTVGAVIALAAAVGSAGYLLWSELKPGPELADVERPRDDGRGHVAGARYSSDTPTSGAHDSRSPRCGLYDTPLDPSLAVHALEHGAVVLWYQIDRAELADDLAQVADEWDSHVIVTPSETLDEPIVATAWNRRKAYSGVTTDLADFFDTYRRRGPEQVACDQT